VASHNFTFQAVSAPLNVQFTANGDPVFSLLGGGEVPLDERVSYLESESFGAAVRDPQSPLTYALRVDDALVNGNPDAVVIATRAASQGSPAAGVWFDGTHWWIYNEDLSGMPAGEVFFYAEGTGLGGRVQHSAQNDFFGFGVTIDDPRTNGKPDAVVVAQHVFAGALNASPLGVWYDPVSARWVVFNELGSPLALGEWVHYVVAP
jgi:hypothetical protein